MKHLNKIVAVTLISGGLLGSAFNAQAGSEEKEMSETIAMNNTSIKMDKAIEIALAKISGTAKEAEFEMEDGKSIWEVEIIDADQRVYEIEIDANSGEVLKQELDD